jgi:hypothetical protein
MTAHDSEHQRRKVVASSPTLHLQSPLHINPQKWLPQVHLPSLPSANKDTNHTLLTEATQNTPLAPSVEKAYYRKCIELKRRLNDVEEANDAARQRKARLNRAIMKMRLERAFLLEQLAKRLQNTTDGPGKPANNNSANSD